MNNILIVCILKKFIEDNLIIFGSISYRVDQYCWNMEDGNRKAEGRMEQYMEK